MFCSYTVLYVLVESSSEMSDVEASGEKSPLLDSQTHRESGSSDGGSKARAARSLAGSCGRYCLIAASLPLLPFKRKKSDEVGSMQCGDQLQFHHRVHEMQHKYRSFTRFLQAIAS